MINVSASWSGFRNWLTSSRKRRQTIEKLGVEDMVVLELEAVYAQAAPHTKLLNKRFVGAHHWLGPLKEALVARLAADKVQTRST